MTTDRQKLERIGEEVWHFRYHAKRKKSYIPQVIEDIIEILTDTGEGEDEAVYEKAPPNDEGLMGTVTRRPRPKKKP